MTNMTMVERVARAANPEAFVGAKHPVPMLELFASQVREDALRRAHAAIEAMREPTEAMKRASRITTDIPNPCEGGRLHVWGSNVWSQMTDAALQSP